MRRIDDLHIRPKAAIQPSADTSFELNTTRRLCKTTLKTQSQLQEEPP